MAGVWSATVTRIYTKMTMILKTSWLSILQSLYGQRVRCHGYPLAVRFQRMEEWQSWVAQDQPAQYMHYGLNRILRKALCPHTLSLASHLLQHTIRYGLLWNRVYPCKLGPVTHTRFHKTKLCINQDLKVEIFISFSHFMHHDVCRSQKLIIHYKWDARNVFALNCPRVLT